MSGTGCTLCGETWHGNWHQCNTVALASARSKLAEAREIVGTVKRVFDTSTSDSHGTCLHAAITAAIDSDFDAAAIYRAINGSALQPVQDFGPLIDALGY